MFDERLFIYVYDGAFIQISLEDYSILFKSAEEDNGNRGIIPIEGEVLCN